MLVGIGLSNLHAHFIPPVYRLTNGNYYCKAQLRDAQLSKNCNRNDIFTDIFLTIYMISKFNFFLTGTCFSLNGFCRKDSVKQSMKHKACSNF